jgi:hypothetical protein
MFDQPIGRSVNARADGRGGVVGFDVVAFEAKRVCRH